MVNIKTKKGLKAEEKKVNEKYPSATLLQDACYSDYMRLINTYDKIYDKVNVTLAFCGLVLFVIVDKFDYTKVMELCSEKIHARYFLLLLYVVAMLGSAILIVWAVIALLMLMRSKEIHVVDSVAIRNEKIYDWLPDEAALWLIGKCTDSVYELRDINKNKQKQFDRVTIKVIVAILFYALMLIVEKGL